MTKQKRFRFTVEGSGVFPVDMLRYDACWPDSEGRDSDAIAQTMMFSDLPVRRVVLVTDNPSAPTVGRWESFTWRVVAIGEARDPAQHPTPGKGCPPYVVRS